MSRPLVVRKNSKGRGVYAARPFSKGEIVEIERAVREELAQVEATIARINRRYAGSIGVGVSTEDQPAWDEAHRRRSQLKGQLHELAAPDREAAAAVAQQELYARMSVDEARVAALPVYQRRNGWEVVKDGVNYVLRHPGAKVEAYRHHKLSRVREVADESQPD